MLLGEVHYTTIADRLKNRDLLLAREVCSLEEIQERLAVLDGNPEFYYVSKKTRSLALQRILS